MTSASVDIPNVSTGPEAGTPGQYLSGVNRYMIIREINTRENAVLKVPFNDLMPDKFKDSGVAEVSKIVVHYSSSVGGSKINIAVANQGTMGSVSALAMSGQGHQFTFNDLTLGRVVEVDIPIAAKLSRRIRGTDDKGMPAQFMLTCSKGMNVIVCFHVILHGIETIFESGN